MATVALDLRSVEPLDVQRALVLIEDGGMSSCLLRVGRSLLVAKIGTGAAIGHVMK